MECNKEEALRARDIALKKMELKDFIGARKFALKAQQLYRDVENISQMICVCDVHCSAESNMTGKDLDWYGILQIERTADEVMIRKQYRKFALLLHPDKNKFAGAEAAFKLIGEAQRVLVDKDARSLYDMKCRTSLVRQNQPAQHAGRNANVSKTSRVPNSVPGSTNFRANVTNQHSSQQAQQGAAVNGKETFWTQCPFCLVRYQYFKEVTNRALRCQGCKKPFIAYDIIASGVRPGSDATQPVFNGQTIPNAFGSKARSEAVKKQASNVTFQSKLNPEASRSQKAGQSHKGPTKVEQGSKASRKGNNKRRKKYIEESSESFGSDSSLESEEVEIQTDSTQQFDSNGGRCTRRSSRNKQRVSYNENVSDDEQTTNPSKKAKNNGPCGPTAEVDASEQRSKPFVSASATCKERNIGEGNKSNGSEPKVESTKKSFEADDVSISESSPESTPEPELHEYPDPDFSDFDKLREVQCFKAGQVWAIYDTADAMPRFYAVIKKVFSSGFKVRITWLEANPDDTLGSDWIKAELPFACGKFKYGDSENIEDRPMFSHEVKWEKGVGRNSVLIYPRKGETWALFKNWDSKSYSISKNADFFEYEYVEVLSDYDESVGIRVSQLGKLKGFASLFCRRSTTEIRIPPLEILKFSHRVPSFQMTGEEREDVPKDSFELDPAAITWNLEEISCPGS